MLYSKKKLPKGWRSACQQWFQKRALCKEFWRTRLCARRSATGSFQNLCLRRCARFEKLCSKNLLQPTTWNTSTRKTSTKRKRQDDLWNATLRLDGCKAKVAQQQGCTAPAEHLRRRSGAPVRCFFAVPVQSWRRWRLGLRWCRVQRRRRWHFGWWWRLGGALH